MSIADAAGIYYNMNKENLIPDNNEAVGLLTPIHGPQPTRILDVAQTIPISNEATPSISNLVDISWIQQDGIEGTHTSLGVPAANKSKSGATIASGFDIGQHSTKQIEDYFGEGTTLTEKLLPFVGLKGTAAENKIKELKTTFTKDELNLINDTIYPDKINKVINRFNDNSEVKFDKLPLEFQTVIASVGFQYGNMKYPKDHKDSKKAGEDFNFYKYITEGNWGKAIEELKNFGDDYQPRHTKEAKLMEQGVTRRNVIQSLKNTPNFSLM